MFFEYALEPSALSSWERVRFFADAFGPWKGRFLGRYPKRWKKLVVDGLTCGPREKLKIVEYLERLDDRVFARRPGANWNEGEPWLPQALRESTRLAGREFRAIIATNPDSQPGVLDAADVSDADARWRVPAGRLMKREPLAFGDAVHLLLQVSTRVIVIDPYFRPFKTWQRDVILEFVNRQPRQPGRVEVHFATECGRDIRDEAARIAAHSQHYQECVNAARTQLPRALPPGSRIHLTAWRPTEGDPRLHNRYLLTDVGGLQFGDGLERGKPSHEDRVSILDEDSRARLWDAYLGAAPAFTLSGPAIEVAGR